MINIDDNIIEQILKRQEENILIAHYTTMEAFHGMLSSITSRENVSLLKLWASNIFTLNDPKEFLYGYSIIRKWLPKIESELCVQNQDKLSCIWDTINVDKKDHTKYNKLLWASLHSQSSPYILSFSRDVDNLAMFRMYGNNAYGVCLVFSYGILKNSCAFYDVCYDEKVDNCYYSPYDMLKTEYKLYLNELQETRFNNNNEKFKLMLKYLIAYISITAPFIKRGDYEYEKEIRFASVNKSSESVQFRMSQNGNIIPYKEIDVPLKALKRIIIGPCANFESSKYAIELKFRSKGIAKVPDIVESQNEYRVL